MINESDKSETMTVHDDDDLYFDLVIVDIISSRLVEWN